MSALLPPFLEGVSERSERVWISVGQVLTPEAFLLDGLMSPCAVRFLQLNLTTRMVANQTINIKEEALASG